MENKHKDRNPKPGKGFVRRDYEYIRHGTVSLLAEAEAPEPRISPEEDRVHRRRLAFYQRVGFRLMPYQADIFHVRYAMLVWSESCVLDEETLQNTHRGLYQSQMPPVLFCRMIHIPAAHCGKKE